MKTLKLLIKTSFFNKINDFMCFNIIIFNGRSNKVFISYIFKINTQRQPRTSPIRNADGGIRIFHPGHIPPDIFPLDNFPSFLHGVGHFPLPPLASADLQAIYR